MKPADAARPPSSQRGYGNGWPRVRAEVFTLWHIPPEIVRGMNIHHFPRFIPGTDHAKYRLTPVPHGFHSQHTIRETHQGRPAEWRDSIPLAGQLFSARDLAQPSRWDWE